MKGFFSFAKQTLSVLGGIFLVMGGGQVSAQQGDLSTLFESLSGQGGSAEDVLLGLMENGVELDSAAGYTVASVESIGLSIAYAQAAVCLAPDQPSAQAVGQIAADSADEAAKNAVQAGVVTALSSYAKGECRLLLDELNNAGQAFASSTAGGEGGTNAGGGAPPVAVDDPSISESQ